MNDVFNSMRLDERYADAASRARSISDQLADLRDIYDALALPAYADVVSEMADDLTVQSIHMDRLEKEHEPTNERPVLVDESFVTPGILAELSEVSK